MNKELKFGTLNKKRNASFVGFYLKSKCYEGYKNVPEQVRDLDIPQILLLQRWDGKLGYVGGMVDEGEDILTAAIREVKEEINLDISDFNLELTEICTHEASENLHVHFYAVEIDLDIKRHILENAYKGSDYEAETCGVVFQQILDGDKFGINKFLENAYLATAVKEETEILIEKFDLKIKQ